MSEENKKEEINEEKSFDFGDILEKNKNSRVWSVAAVIAGALSILLFRISVIGMILALVSVCLAVVSRKILGYFDGIAIAGLIVGIFGIVFGIFGLIFDYMIEHTVYFRVFLMEIGLM